MGVRRFSTALCLALLVGLITASSASAFGFITKWGGPGTGDGQFKDMYGIATDPNGAVWVPDNDGNRVEKFSSTGQFLLMIGWGVQDGAAKFEICSSGCRIDPGGSGDGQFGAPQYAATDAAGNLYVTDTGNNRVEKFSSDGAFIAKWGSFGTSEGQFDGPRGIAVDPSGNVYVADSNNARVEKFDSNGHFLLTFGWNVQSNAGALQVCTSGCQAGANGMGDGQFDGIKDVAAGPDGSIYAVDPNNDRVQRFSSIGAFIGKWGENGTSEGKFVNAVGVTTAPNGDVYVSDGTNHRIQKFTSAGQFLSTFGWGVQNGAAQFQVCTSGCAPGIAGSGDGQFSGLEKLATDCRGFLYVPDFTRLDVQKFGEPGTSEPPCPAASPSNAFTIGKLIHNKKKGIVYVPVTVPAAGALTLDGKGLVTQRPARTAAPGTARAVAGPGTEILKMKAKGKSKHKLRRKGKLKVAAKVTYTPQNGSPAAKTVKTTLRKRLKHHKKR